jgi:hypothetical protein
LIHSTTISKRRAGDEPGLNPDFGLTASTLNQLSRTGVLPLGPETAS